MEFSSIWPKLVLGSSLSPSALVNLQKWVTAVVVTEALEPTQRVDDRVRESVVVDGAAAVEESFVGIYVQNSVIMMSYLNTFWTDVPPQRKTYKHGWAYSRRGLCECGADREARQMRFTHRMAKVFIYHDDECVLLQAKGLAKVAQNRQEKNYKGLISNN